MKKGLIIYSIASAITASVIISCADNSGQYSVDQSGIFRLSSGQEAFTRAAETTFNPGTAYQLYAIEGTAFQTNYLKSPPAPGAATGYEAEDNTIDNIPVKKFNGKTLNFYSVTNSTSTPVTIDKNGEIPTCAIRYDASGNPLTDIMWAKKTNQTYLNSGTIKLPFQHTLAKLNLYVLKNAEVTENVILTEISLKDYGQGALNMLTGEYATDDAERRNHGVTVLKGANIAVGTTASSVKGPAGNQVAPMVFPTRKTALNQATIDAHALRISVTVNIGNTGGRPQETKITTLLAEDPDAPEAPFNFKANHQYDVVITVTKSSLVVTIVPRAYDWIPEENIMVDSDVNGSMTIGGITWMDRNLGASSGDPLAGDQAWEDSRGYYYQFRRNIPYYIKSKTDANGISYAPAHGNWHLEESMPYPFVPNHMDDAPIFSPNSQETAAVYPKDTGKFNFIYGYDSWNPGDDRSSWGNTDNPCPKGWRVPSKDEFQLIIPTTPAAGDIPFMLHSGDTYREYISSDPEAGSNTVYVGVKKGTWTETDMGITNVIYGLKRENTDNAYYLRWHIERSGVYEIPNDNTSPTDKGDPYRNVLVISRYPATDKSKLTADNVRTAASWNNPVEQVRLPISGYIHLGYEHGKNTPQRPALIYSGTETVYWTSDANGGNRAYTVRMKFAGNATDAQIKMYNDEVYRNGCLIRCVRDTKAN